MRRSSLVVVATLALLLTSAVPAAGRLQTWYQLNATCTAVGGFAAELVADGTKGDVNSALRSWIKDVPCVKGTVEYTIAPYSGG